MTSNGLETVGGLTLFAAGYVGASTDGWSSYGWVLLISLVGWIILDASRRAL